MTEPSASAFRALLLPPLLWAGHFLAVYVFVSLACLWGWHRMEVPLVQVVVAGLTVAVVAAVLLATRVTARMPGFLGRTGGGVGLLFAGATLVVGLPPLLAPVCR